MAGFNEIQRSSAQSIQSTINDGEAPAYAQQDLEVSPQAAPLGADNAVLSGGGPSYMQAIEALMFTQIALNANGASNGLGNLQAFSGARSARDGERSFATNYGKDNNFGVFNPMNYPQPGVNGRGGNGGYTGGNGYGGRTGAGNVSTGGIDRMIELILAQTLGQGPNAADSLRLQHDEVTLVGRSPDSEANPFHELTGGLIKLLAEKMNGAGENTPQPSPAMRSLLTQLAQQPYTGASSELLSHPQLLALMDEMSVMQLIQGTRSNSEPAVNPMVSNIMALMQNLLGAQSGGNVSASQMQSLLGALMSNLESEGNEASPAAAMMKEMLPEMMALLAAEASETPGAVAPHDPTSPVRLAPFRASVQSNGSLSGRTGRLNGASEGKLHASDDGGIMILDGSKERDIAGGFGIGASVGMEEDGDERIKVGTFSWNGGQDAIALNAKGEAGVTSDGGRTWASLPMQGVSTYNPGNGGPTLTYNPDAKTVSFTASGSNNDTISAEMHADGNGVSFTNIESAGVTAGGQLASALS